MPGVRIYYTTGTEDQVGRYTGKPLDHAGLMGQSVSMAEMLIAETPLEQHDPKLMQSRGPAAGRIQ